MTRTHTVASTAALAVGLALAGCERTPAEEQERATEAMEKAGEKVGEATKEATEETREATKEAARDTERAFDREPATVGVDVDKDGVIDREGVDSDGDGVVDPEREPVRGTEADEIQKEQAAKTAEAKEDLAEEKTEAKQEADEEVAAAKEEIAEERTQMRDWGIGQVRDLDRDIADIEIEMREAEPTVQRQVEPQLVELRKERDGMMTQVAAIENKPADELDSFKEQLEAKFDRLDDRVELLRDTL